MSSDEKFKVIKARFPKAKFAICCFDTIDEIENKILCSDDFIIYNDTYDIQTKINGKWKETEKYYDYFVVKKRDGENYIYYKDVIDVLIKAKFDRKTNSDHFFMENIRLIQSNKNFNHSRNKNSIKFYGSVWGS
jgi:hypothetical protein